MIASRLLGPRLRSYVAYALEGLDLRPDVVLLSPVKSYPLNLNKSRKIVPLLFTYLADVLSLLRNQILGKESIYGPKRTTNDA